MLNCHQQEIVRLAKFYLKEDLKNNKITFSSSSAVKDYIQLNISKEEREVFGVLFLNSQHQLLSDNILFKGTIDSATVHPREVVKYALLNNAAAVILYHNHPSGCVDASNADRNITKTLIEALSLLDIRVLDHFIVGVEDILSFSEIGYI